MSFLRSKRMSVKPNAAQQQLQIAHQQMMQAAIAQQQAMAQQMYSRQQVRNQLNQLQQYQQGLGNQQLSPQMLRYAEQVGMRVQPLESKDYFGEVTAWRCWRMPVRPVLTSCHVTQFIWMPGAIEEADAGEHLEDDGAHGLYAWKDERLATNYAVECCNSSASPIVVGSVKLWGTIITHERGYRAQYAKITSLDFIACAYTEPHHDRDTMEMLRERYQLEPPK